MVHEPLPSEPNPDAGIHKLRHQVTRHMAACGVVEVGRVPSEDGAGTPSALCHWAISTTAAIVDGTAYPCRTPRPSHAHMPAATNPLYSHNHTLTLHDASSITQHLRGRYRLAFVSSHAAVLPILHSPPIQEAEVPNTFTHIPHGMLRLFLRLSNHRSFPRLVKGHASRVLSLANETNLARHHAAPEPETSAHPNAAPTQHRLVSHLYTPQGEGEVGREGQRERDNNGLYA
ncbi:hypothetical protein LY78DRAFT_664273 [Colletotrichum sublineola]|nr:hypothetical protein LY78DRAFT_664273 [Colletotrichum sublineola]